MMYEYKKIRQSELQELETEVIAENDINSCIFCNASYDLNSTIGAMKTRYHDIVTRIKNLEFGKYSKLNSVKYEIAMGLYTIHKDNLYLVSEYNSTYDLAMSELGFSRITASNYIRVAKRFINKQKPISIFNDSKSGIDFTIGQLIYLLPLTDDEIRHAIDIGLLQYTTSINSIKLIVKQLKEERYYTPKQKNKTAIHEFKCKYENFYIAYTVLEDYMHRNNDWEGINDHLPEIKATVADLYEEGMKHLKEK